MIRFVTALYFALLWMKFFCNGFCPLDPVKPTQNITQLTGTWKEYKKTSQFLASNTCTTYHVTCSNDTACNINKLSNGTQTGYTTTLIVNDTSTMWGKDIIYLNVDPDNEFVIFWNCHGEDIKKYELAVLMKNLSNTEAMDVIDILLENIKIDYLYKMETVNNTLCSGVEKLTMHFAVLIMLIFRTIAVINVS